MLAQIITMKPRDPREQDVIAEHDETDALFTVRPDRVDFAGILIEAGKNPHGIDAPPERCSACGELRHLHLDTSGCFFIGCTGALRRKTLGLTDEPRKSDSYYWGDQHPAVSAAIRLVLQTACGQVTDTYNELPIDQQMETSRKLAVFAVRAYLADESRGNR